MPRPRVLIALLSLAVFGMTACTQETAPPDTASLPDAKTLLADSAVAMGAVESAHVKIETEGEISTVPLRRAEGDLLRSGDAKGAIQLLQSGVLVEMEFVVVGDFIHLKGATGGWQKLPLSAASAIYDPSIILDPDRGIVKVLSTAADPVTEAKEEVDGVSAYRVAVSLNDAAVSALVPGVTAGATGKLWLSESSKHLIKAVLTVPGLKAGETGTVTVSISAIDVPVSVSAP